MTTREGTPTTNENLLLSIRNLFSGHMGWSSEEVDAVDFLLSCYVSPFLPDNSNDIAWGCLTGGASTGKSEIHRLVDGYPPTVRRDLLTENAFHSQYRDDSDRFVCQNNSLLDALSWDADPVGPKVFQAHEMSSLLNMKPERVNQFFANMRNLHDGKFVVASGNIGHREYSRVVVGFIGASTEVIDKFLRANQTMGERLFTFRMGEKLTSLSSRIALGERVGNIPPAEKGEFRAKAHELTTTLLDRTLSLLRSSGQDPRPSSTIPKSLGKSVGELATVATTIRTCPLGRREPVSIPESPARLIGQLRSFGDARILLQGRREWRPSDLPLLRRIASNTIHPGLLRLTHTLWRGGPDRASDWITMPEVASASKVPYTMVEDQLLQWLVVDWVEASEFGYRLTDTAIRLLVSSEFLLLQGEK